MSIYDNGTEFPWEIWLGLAIAAVALYLALRVTRKADRRRQARSSSTRPSSSPKGSRPPSDSASRGG